MCCDSAVVTAALQELEGGAGAREAGAGLLALRAGCQVVGNLCTGCEENQQAVWEVLHMHVL